MRGVLSVFLLLSLLFVPLWALAEENGSLYRVPVLEDFAPALQDDGSPHYITALEIEQILKRQSPDFTKLYWNEKITRYLVLQHDWLEKLLATYDAFLSATNTQGKAETWDCENYSELLNVLTTIRIWKAGYYDSHGAIGWLQVDAEKKWAGIPAEMHALMFAVTDKGVFIIEPQNGQTIQLEKYPNRSFIEEAYLF